MTDPNSIDRSPRGARASVVAIVGAGPAGLAAAAMLRSRGVSVRILEKGDGVGARWRQHYDRLRLHTTRRGSGLPGLPIPAAYGRWVSRDDFVRYQESYAKHHRLDVESGVTVERVERTDGGWRVLTSKGAVEATHVVIGAGHDNLAHLPDWPGRERFAGELLHSSRYRSGAAHRGKRVLVIGSGNSGAEIATDLAEQGAEVWWSSRTPPTILPRAVIGVATQRLGILLRPLPPAVVDPVVSVFGRLTIPSLSRYGLPRPSRGAYTAVLRDHVLPILDVGLVAAIRRGRVRPVPAVASFESDSVVLANGVRWSPDAVVAGTGFRPGLEPIVGHLGVLDAGGVPQVHGPAQHPSAPGIFFLGYTNAISGNLREIARHARRIADVLAAT